jgi:hypothetical protein
LDEAPRWQLGCRNRKRELHKSKILLKWWSYTCGNKAPRRIKTLTHWTPSPYKTSPCHVTLTKQEGSWAARHRLQTCLGVIWQTKQVSAKHHAEFPQLSLG